jgi:cytidylate kinase
MAIITISRGSYSRGKEVAEKVAKKLGYDCISRDILLDASEMFKIPEIKLIRAIEDAPSILDRFHNGKERYVAYIQAALLRYFQEDNLVYHGLAGHFFVKDIAHVLKVRIIADMEERVRLEMEREKVSEEKAVRTIKKDDEQRRKWSLFLYGIDTSENSLYDLVIHIKNLNADDATDIICNAASLDRFKTTGESQKRIEDLALAAEVKATLLDLSPYVETTADNGVIHVKAKTHEYGKVDIESQLKKLAGSVKGVKEVNIRVLPVTHFSD